MNDKSDPVLGETQETAERLVDDSLPMPRYYQLYVILRDKIAGGAYSASDGLVPSEQELVESFGVSRSTVRRARARLTAEGLVERHRGRGTFVSSNMPTNPLVASIDRHLENNMLLGRKTEVDLLEFQYVVPSETVRELLGIAADEPVHKTARLRRVQGDPLSYVATFVPPDVAQVYTREELEASDNSMTALLIRAGIDLAHGDQSISATLADAVHAPILETAIGAPLLEVKRVCFDSRERPVAYFRALYRADRYQYRLKLEHVGAR